MSTRACCSCKCLPYVLVRFKRATLIQTCKWSWFGHMFVYLSVIGVGDWFVELAANSGNILYLVPDLPWTYHIEKETTAICIWKRKGLLVSACQRIWKGPLVSACQQTKKVSQESDNELLWIQNMQVCQASWRHAVGAGHIRIPCVWGDPKEM